VTQWDSDLPLGSPVRPRPAAVVECHSIGPPRRKGARSGRRQTFHVTAHGPRPYPPEDGSNNRCNKPGCYRVDILVGVPCPRPQRPPRERASVEPRDRWGQALKASILQAGAEAVLSPMLIEILQHRESMYKRTLRDVTPGSHSRRWFHLKYQYPTPANLGVPK
jgi:hypothetical protein